QWNDSAPRSTSLSTAPAMMSGTSSQPTSIRGPVRSGNGCAKADAPRAYSSPFGSATTAVPRSVVASSVQVARHAADAPATLGASGAGTAVSSFSAAVTASPSSPASTVAALAFHV